MIRLATRGSALALVQARMAADALHRLHPREVFELTPIETCGDRAQTVALTEVQQEGVFVKELEQALLDGRADLAVHSAKDLPSRVAGGLVIALGVVVDDAVIDVENILRRRRTAGDNVDIGTLFIEASLEVRRPVFMPRSAPGRR